MRYLGGKTRLAKEICAAILNDTDARDTYIEPFIGGGSVFAEMNQHFDIVRGGDAQEDLALLWRGLISGSFTPPEELTEDEWRDLRDSLPSALRGFAGYGCSFGGRFFEGYARNKMGTNYAAQSARSLRKDLAKITPGKTAVFESDYRDWNPGRGDVVYCDPPYRHTKHYVSKRSGLEHFDHDEFWEVMREWRSRGVLVYVSEFSAPDDWEVVWEKKRKVGVGTESGASYTEKVDKLFK